MTIDEKTLKQLQREFLDAYNKDKIIGAALMKSHKGTATYKDVDRYAVRLGKIREQTILKYAKDIDPSLYAELGEKIVLPGMKDNYDFICDVATETQEALNRKARLGLKGIKPEFNADKAEGIVNKVIEATDYDEVSSAINQNITTFSKGVVSDAIHDNADFQSGAGLSPVIVRIAGANCCAWCSQMAGTYEYEDVKDTGNDVYRFHANCTCRIEFDPRNGARRINTKTQKEV